ncbi:hypothetical protein PR048_010039 [Dryococelus australis]|uniref:Uncharacterized protein n=1 Tax=Dryococelus australis TaxID=614101 RepID=A0ABQ9I2N8_9NEOP|nr:hypothetical protein PR048_010039 [Dryococelus australis]
MLEHFVKPQLVSDGILNTAVFQHDGALPEFPLIVSDYLNRMLPRWWIGRSSPNIWTPRSPDLTLLDFFMWGCINSHNHRVKITSLHQLCERIVEAVNSIAHDQLQRVFSTMAERWSLCIDK